MRIIKLSSRDIDFPDRASVDVYFDVTLRNRNPVGQFLLTQGRIAEDGIETGETIIFSYVTELTHIAKAASGRQANSGGETRTYPFYFLVDINSLSPAHGSLADVEAELSDSGVRKNIVRTQGWPRIIDSPEVESIWNKHRGKPEQRRAW